MNRALSSAGGGPVAAAGRERGEVPADLSEHQRSRSWVEENSTLEPNDASPVLPFDHTQCTSEGVLHKRRCAGLLPQFFFQLNSVTRVLVNNGTTQLVQFLHMPCSLQCFTVAWLLAHKEVAGLLYTYSAPRHNGSA